MKYHPILFQPTMIEALRAGRKSQTRRLPNTTNTLIDGRGWRRGEIDQLDFGLAWLDNGPSPAGNDGPYLKVPNLDGETIHRIYPRVQVGDRLWVREAHFALGHWEKKGELKKNGQPKMRFVQHQTEPVRFSEPDHGLRFPRNTTFGWYPRNSLFMRRKDCRLVLPVTNVRFQRLQDISVVDAIDEGVIQEPRPNWHFDRRWHDYSGEADYFADPRNSFDSLITTINGPEAWVENKWVVAYTFEVSV